MTQFIELPMQPLPVPPLVMQPLAKDDLMAVLLQWHKAPESERPPSFPGPFAKQSTLETWLGEIADRCVALYRPIPQQQWVNAALAWIPEAGKGVYGLREQLLDCMREKRRTGEWEMDRFWDWEKFRSLFFKVCVHIVRKHRIKQGTAVLFGGAAVGGAACMLIPAAVSEAALCLTTMASGAAAPMSIGAQCALPAAVNPLAGAVGALGIIANAVGIGKGKERARKVAEILGDIGDDGNDILGDIGDE